MIIRTLPILYQQAQHSWVACNNTEAGYHMRLCLVCGRVETAKFRPFYVEEDADLRLMHPLQWGLA